MDDDGRLWNIDVVGKCTNEYCEFSLFNTCIKINMWMNAHGWTSLHKWTIINDVNEHRQIHQWICVCDHVSSSSVLGG